MAVEGCRVLIVGGGTGGHISPGIALYQEFIRKGARAFFLTGARDKRFSLLEEVSENELFLYRAPSLTRNIFKIPFFFLMFIAAVFRARSIMKRMNINAVLGMGGYVSAPGLLAAKMLKLPLYLCEQNSVPGKVTLLFEKSSKRIFGTFDISKNYVKFPERYQTMGNPVRRELLEESGKDEAKKAFHLSHSGKVILVIGGSQGARRLNELIFNMKKEYPGDFEDTGIIWSTGTLSYDKLKELVHAEMDEGSIYLSPYIKDVGKAYRAADIAISRAGAGVMMELAAAGVPSILVPYPYAASNHQEINADEFVSAGAAVKIMDRDAVAANVVPVLRELLGSQRNLERMSEKAVVASRKDAAERIVIEIMEERSCSESQ
jgi:UDP-N-acetylglucosamine--N-acetylmuramyl-(pentapeptide) pyrophosphoryl-undecaprenol N-acetylglucosamine transferase